MRREQGRLIVRRHVLWSIGAGLMPIPLLDIAAVTAIQIDMLKQLTALYGVPFTEAHGKAFVTALSGSILARLGANAIKLIPGIGTILGGISMSVLSGASTYAIGEVAINHFEGGGNFSTMDMDSAKKAYEEHFEKGKTVAADMAKDSDKSKDVFEKLEKLGQLRDKGVITPEDFEAQKKKFLDQL